MDDDQNYAQLTGNDLADREILLELNDEDLEKYCNTSKTAQKFCSNPNFWLAKIRLIPKIQTPILKYLVHPRNIYYIYKYLNEDKVFDFIYQEIKQQNLDVQVEFVENVYKLIKDKKIFINRLYTFLAKKGDYKLMIEISLVFFDKEINWRRYLPYFPLDKYKEICEMLYENFVDPLEDDKEQYNEDFITENEYSWANLITIEMSDDRIFTLLNTYNALIPGVIPFLLQYNLSKVAYHVYQSMSDNHKNRFFYSVFSYYGLLKDENIQHHEKLAQFIIQYKLPYDLKDFKIIGLNEQVLMLFSEAGIYPTESLLPLQVLQLVAANQILLRNGLPPLKN